MTVGPFLPKDGHWLGLSPQQDDKENALHNNRVLTSYLNVVGWFPLFWVPASTIKPWLWSWEHFQRIDIIVQALWLIVTLAHGSMLLYGVVSCSRGPEQSRMTMYRIWFSTWIVFIVASAYGWPLRIVPLQNAMLLSTTVTLYAQVFCIANFGVLSLQIVAFYVTPLLILYALKAITLHEANEEASTKAIVTTSDFDFHVFPTVLTISSVIVGFIWWRSNKKHQIADPIPFTGVMDAATNLGSSRTPRAADEEAGIDSRSASKASPTESTASPSASTASPTASTASPTAPTASTASMGVSGKPGTDLELPGMCPTQMDQMAPDDQSETSFVLSESPAPVSDERIELMTTTSNFSLTYSESSAGPAALTTTGVIHNEGPSGMIATLPDMQSGIPLSESSPTRIAFGKPPKLPTSAKNDNPRRFRPAKQNDNQSVSSSSCSSETVRRSASSASLGVANRDRRHDRYSVSQSPSHSPRGNSALNGTWVIVNNVDSIREVDDWLQHFTITDGNVMDGIGNACRLVKKRRHTLFEGGALFLSSDANTLYRVGKSGVRLTFRRVDTSQD